MSEYRSIKRHGDNSEYLNVPGLPFAPDALVDVELGVTYLAGRFVGGRRCGADCGTFIAVNSHVQYFRKRWRHERCMPQHHVSQCVLCGQSTSHPDAWGLCSKITPPHKAARAS